MNLERDAESSDRERENGDRRDDAASPPSM
jgi:hypothetical protein